MARESSGLDEDDVLELWEYVWKRIEHINTQKKRNMFTLLLARAEL